MSLRRNNFGFIFQFFNLFENDTVFNNLRLVLENKNEHEIKKDIDDVLKKLNISNLKEMVVKNLSGGENAVLQNNGIYKLWLTNASYGEEIFDTLSHGKYLQTFDQEPPTLDEIFKMKAGEEHE